MSAPQTTPITDHQYDGIEEFDNPVPPWWNWIFLLTFLFSVPYFMYYTVGVGETLEQSYDAETAAFFEVMAKQLGDIEPDAPTLLRLGHDEKLMITGRVLFRANCAVCHMPDGGGNTGPNLTDDHFLNVKKIEDLYTVIHDGSVPKGMPAWSKTFGKPQMVVLAAYIASLRGTKPAAAKAPQGNAIPPWPAWTPPPAATGDGAGGATPAPGAAKAPAARTTDAN
ncbi:MAG: c-type cytochrome [Phycisphaerae bacterium]|nr:c-type cytochrome [Phycisphaerae bacterium]